MNCFSNPMLQQRSLKFVKLLQIGLLEGTDVTDHFRRVTLVADEEGDLYLSNDYEESFNESLEKMQKFINEQTEQAEQGE